MGKFKILVPWLVIAMLCTGFGMYASKTKQELNAQSAELRAEQQRIQELGKTLSEAQAQLDVKEKDYQALKALYAQSSNAAPALHVVGVYEGKTPPGADDRPWWAKCDGHPGVKNLSELSRDAQLECHRKYAGEQSEKEVVVDISDSTRPIILALTAYDKTNWKVKLSPGVEIKKVILDGYHAQRISGVPEGTTIETFTSDPSPCPRCIQGGRHFYSYESPPMELREITGLEVTSFQGKYKGESFSIFPGIRSFSRELAKRN